MCYFFPSFFCVLLFYFVGRRQRCAARQRSLAAVCHRRLDVDVSSGSDSDVGVYRLVENVTRDSEIVKHKQRQWQQQEKPFFHPAMLTELSF